MANPEMPGEDQTRGSEDLEGIDGLIDSAVIGELLVAERNVLHSEIMASLNFIHPLLDNGHAYFRLAGSSGTDSIFVAHDYSDGKNITTFVRNLEIHTHSNAPEPEAIETNALGCMVVADDPKQYFGAFEILRRAPFESWDMPRSAVLMQLKSDVLQFFGPRQPDKLKTETIEDTSTAHITTQIKSYEYLLPALRLCSPSLQQNFELRRPWKKP